MPLGYMCKVKKRQKLIFGGFTASFATVATFICPPSIVEDIHKIISWYIGLNFEQIKQKV